MECLYENKNFNHNMLSHQTVKARLDVHAVNTCTYNSFQKCCAIKILL